MQRLRQTRGFTLIELLVTMGLIILLLSIAVVVANSATLDSYRIIGAGDKLSQALLTAKTRAARDKAPRGVRLLVGTDGFLRELIYIEQPENLVTSNQLPSLQNGLPTGMPPSMLVIRYPQRVPGGAPTYPKPDPAACQLFLVLNSLDSNAISTRYVLGSQSIVSSPDLSATFAFNNVQVVPNTALAYAPTGTTVYQLTNLVNGVPAAINNPDLGAGQTPTTQATMGTFQTTLFGVFVGSGTGYPARPLAGEPTIILSKNAAVDPLASLPPVVLGPTDKSIDIMFSPSGQVMYRSEGLICFLVRDTFKFTPTVGTVVSSSQNYTAAGEMVLVTIYPKTGTIVTKPVADPNGSDPYQFARDAINTGL